MKKYINILIEDNKMDSKFETIDNLKQGMEYTLELDTGRLTIREQQILEEVGQEQLICLYCDAIKSLLTKTK